MKNIDQFLIEKLKITSDTKIKKQLTPDSTQYKGVKFIEQYTNISKKDFKRYGSISLDSAYEIAQIIIDNCKNELQGYYFSLYYSGYSGFAILNPEYDYNSKNYKQCKEGLIAFYAGADKTGYQIHFDKIKESDATNKLKEFIGKDTDKFNI